MPRDLWGSPPLFPSWPVYWRLLSLSLVLSALVACVTAPGPAPDARTAPARSSRHGSLLSQAATLAQEGDLTQARSVLAQVPEPRYHTPPVSFLRACLALESGDLDVAEMRLKEWPSYNEPEVQMLLRLITARREQPALDWRQAFLQAWRAEGQPDLRGSRLLPEGTLSPSLKPVLAPVWSRSLPDDSRFVLALALGPHPERSEFVLQHLSNSLPPEFSVAASDLLLNERSLCEPERARRTAALRAHLTRLAEAWPNALEFPLMALLVGTSDQAPLSPEELGRLEALSQRSTWRQTDFSTLYQSALQALEPFGLTHAQAQGLAYGLAVGTITGSTQVVLQHRIQASVGVLTPEQLARVGGVLERLGERLAAQSSLVERSIGLGLMSKGIGLSGDIARQPEVDAARARWREADTGLPRTAFARWPLHSLGEAMFAASLRDEYAHLWDFRVDSPAP